jgi:hypothetical protein
LNTSDIDFRYESTKEYLQRSEISTTYFPRFRDDQLALADYLRSQTNSSSLLGQLTGEGSLNALVYMGHSFGGAASASSVQIDDRALCAVNMDGFQFSPSLLGAAVGKPFLTLVSGRVESGRDTRSSYFNEFFYEPMTTMGSSDTVIRTRVFDAIHADFWDWVFLPEEIRGPGIEGQLMHEIVAGFVLGFLSTCVSPSTSDWTQRSSLKLFRNETENVDVTYVATWANKQVVVPTPPPAPTSMVRTYESSTKSIPFISMLKMILLTPIALLHLKAGRRSEAGFVAFCSLLVTGVVFTW